MLASALAPLRPFGITKVIVQTMQAVSGAGYPGVPSLDILGNVVPYIGGEEDKMETETQKILGTDGGRAPHAMRISAHTNRVPVIDGHTITVSVEFAQAPGHRRPSWRPCAPSRAGRRSWACRARPTRPSR